jgi:ribonuclease G
VQTNLDAVDEIGRQLRLRDIGGIIVLDLIDMSSATDRRAVMSKLEEVLRRDRTRTKVTHISPLGLVEMTRKRTDQSVTDMLTCKCEYCDGLGRILSPETVAIQIEREVKRRCAVENVEAILIYVNPQVAAQLIGPEGENFEATERRTRCPIYIRARHDFHVERWEVHPCEMMEMEQQLMPFHGGQVVECDVRKDELIVPPRSAAWVDGYFVDLADGVRYQGQKLRVRLTDVRRSFAYGEPVASARSVDRSEPI